MEKMLVETKSASHWLTEWLTWNGDEGFVKGLEGITNLSEVSWKFPVFLK